MSRRCVNPGCYSSGSNDAGPPEFVSDNSAECAECGAELDLDDDEHSVNEFGLIICEYCTEDEEEEEEDDAKV
jgi:hypothetical protein